ncbi:hypothetical protein OPV22_023423 [Ensete ventricosum]|uniref:Uncharacterized protein n=1 Tax=Ensete ventricosum TaxID=4639 RepID=A0AAV8QM57_ENSVE|nr:hypothetical protein OPV22_023423 [Ensete ventricosum]
MRLSDPTVVDSCAAARPRSSPPCHECHRLDGSYPDDDDTGDLWLQIFLTNGDPPHGLLMNSVLDLENYDPEVLDYRRDLSFSIAVALCDGTSIFVDHLLS